MNPKEQETVTDIEFKFTPDWLRRMQGYIDRRVEVDCVGDRDDFARVTWGKKVGKITQLYWKVDEVENVAKFSELGVELPASARWVYWSRRRAVYPLNNKAIFTYLALPLTAWQGAVFDGVLCETRGQADIGNPNRVLREECWRKGERISDKSFANIIEN